MAPIERGSDELTLQFKTTPYKHQLECLKRFGMREYFALLAEMGTGKTWIMINNIAWLSMRGQCDVVLVFAPNGVHSNWARLELPKHMPDEIHYHCAAWSSTSKKAEKIKLDKLVNGDHSELRILTMNWESLQTKRGFDFAETLCKSAKRLMIVCDESDAIKNPSAARTKSLMKLKKYSVYRRIMTGTPINNAPFDAFSQFSFLDESILKTKSFYAFKSEYAEMLPPDSPLLRSICAKTGSRWAPQIVVRDDDGRQRYKNLDKLSSLIAPHSFRVLKKDCLDLPEKIHKTLFFDLTPKQNAVYKQAKEECRLEFDGQATPFSKLVSLQKLSQITSGYYTLPFSKTPLRIDGPNPKLALLIDRVKSIVQSGEKIIIWARYRVEINDIIDALQTAKISAVQYHGGVDKNDRVSAIDAFEHGDAEVFVGNQQAGGTGITLVSASYVIYFSNNFSLRDRLQSEDRAHRIGQTKNVIYINLAAKDTIDEVVIDALINKKDVADAIIDKGLN